MHHLTPRAPPICRKDHPCIERSASHFQLFPLTMGDRRWARAGRAVPPIGVLEAALMPVSLDRTDLADLHQSILVVSVPDGRAESAGRGGSDPSCAL
jgi:hypothetical protein